jgi:hypothetical protein
MGWLLLGLAVLGLLALGLVGMGLLDRLRRNRAAVEELKRSLDEGRARLRVGQRQLRAWRERRGSGSSGRDA